MKIRVVFYKADRDGHWLDDIISGWTKLFNPRTKPYSHVEVWIPKYEKMFEVASSYKGRFSWIDGECFTSTMRGDAKGTCLHLARKVFTHPERWDFFEIDVPYADFQLAKKHARIAVDNNKGYDKLMILSFLWPIRFGNKSKAICSEAVQWFLFWCNIFPKIKAWSPRRLSVKLVALKYVVKQLTKEDF